MCVHALAEISSTQKEQKPPWLEEGFCSSGGGIRTRDTSGWETLGMDPTSADA
jgi:hypothetical protein